MCSCWVDKSPTHQHIKKEKRVSLKEAQNPNSDKMEAMQFSTVAASRHFSTASHSFISRSHGQNLARKPTKLQTGSTNSTTSLSSKTLFTVRNKLSELLESSKTSFIVFISFFLFLNWQRELWGLVNSKSVTVRKRGTRGLIVRAEMFGQLTSGLEAAWNKLKGEGSLSQFFHAFNFVFWSRWLVHCLNLWIQFCFRGFD